MTALPLEPEPPPRPGRRAPAELRGVSPGSAPDAAAVVVREAALADVPALERLMAPYVASGDLLPRSNYDLCRHIKEYTVAVSAQGATADAIVGCGSLKIYSRGLGEVAGLAVHPAWQGTGVGRALVDALVAEARTHGLDEVLALTRKPAFFLKLGFESAEREQFPLKVWADCARCPRNNCCDEVAVTLTL